MLVRRQAGLEVRPGWARLSLRDVAAMAIAVRLAGGGLTEGQPSRRLELGAIERACAALQDRGIANPLLDVRMVRHGRSVMALVHGELFDPTNGQLALQLSREALEVPADEVSGGVVAQLDARLQRAPAPTESVQTISGLPASSG